MRRRVGQGSCPERGAYGGSALQGVCLKTIFECPLIGNGDSVIITNERHKAELLYARRVEPRVYRPLPCAQRMAGGFLFNRKLRSLLNKNAPRRSHCGGKENVAFATRRRRRILQSRILSYPSAPFPGLFSSFGEEQNFYSREKICVSALRPGPACSVKAEAKRGGKSRWIQIITGDFGCFPGNLKILLRFPILA